MLVKLRKSNKKKFKYCLFYVELKEKSECAKCDKGKYCDSLGMIAPRGDCDPGYICYEGSQESNPNDGVNGIICPKGGYCPAGKKVI